MGVPRRYTKNLKVGKTKVGVAVTRILKTLNQKLHKKPIVTFGIIYVVGNLLTGLVYFNVIYNLSIHEKIFSLELQNRIEPLERIDEELFCTTEFAQNTCDLQRIMFLGLPLVGEIIFLTIIFVYRKRNGRKNSLITLCISNLIIISLFLYLMFCVPMQVVYKLKLDATKEIDSTINLLNNTNKLTEKYKEINCLICIKSKLEISKNVPKLVEENIQEYLILSVLEINTDKQNTFYKNLIIPFVLFEKNSELKNKIKISQIKQILFPESYLFIPNVSKESVQILMPILTKRLITSNFPKNISNLDDINYKVLEEKEYVKYQKEESEKLVTNINAEINFIDSKIKEIDEIINDNQKIIENFEKNNDEQNSEYEKYVSRPQEAYNNYCSNSSDTDDCKNLKGVISKNKDVINNNKKQLLKYKEDATKYNIDARVYRNNYLNSKKSLQKTLQVIKEDPVLPEYQGGITYNNSKSIFINFSSLNTKPFSEYLAVSLHENLHIYSYHQGESLPIFMEEGMTDYFTNYILKKYFNKSDFEIKGYKYETKIIELLNNKILFKDLLDIYETKSNNKLKEIFTNTYPNVNYKEFIEKGNMLYYVSLGDESTKKQLFEEIETILTL